ncbi:MAG: carbamoyltransferase HypF [Desulfobacterium sp.]|nr:carbamoyltransferase HypF [Desulfobacterium sp.]
MRDKKSDHVAKRLKINGIVQGVGFRPFIFQLAVGNRLCGKIENTADGVSIFVEGTPENIESFCQTIPVKKPPIAQITHMFISDAPVKGYSNFSIGSSKGHQKLKSTLISPDVSICDDCLSELFNPANRRFHYPFINCTNCGPRYTIIEHIPYDRPYTSMKHFQMCPECQEEYDDPLDRRFHAQPNACFRCGPMVSLHTDKGEKVETGNPIQKTIELLKAGKIIAIKGLGGFHLAVDAENNNAVANLRRKKYREEKPLALMAHDIEKLKEFAELNAEEEKVLLSPARPIAIVKKRRRSSIAKLVAPGNQYLGVMLPYTPLHYLLLSHYFLALVMTSGNKSEEPISINNQDAFQKLGTIADFFLIHNRDIYLRSDDSIVRVANQTTLQIRRSRGYVPVPIFLGSKTEEVLACGAELKNTICLTRGNQAFLSQHIGDMENPSTEAFFIKTITHMQQVLDIHPDVIAHDLHPDYLSTAYAAAQKNKQKIGVQHHHAHIVSCMAENKIQEPVIGLAFDGTGYGTDGTIWGGEVLLVDPGKFDRIAHLSYVPMPGSTAAIREPWRMGISYLLDSFGEAFREFNLPMFQAIDDQKINTITQMVAGRINAPMTSSLGRLFDGIAAIAGLRYRVSFEGQAAMEMEMTADGSIEEFYEYSWQEGTPFQINVKPIVQGVVRDVINHISQPVICGKFHNTLIHLFTELSEVIRKTTGLNRIVLSGGVFQNQILLKGFSRSLSGKGFEVLSHSMVPCNDGGISLGQAIIASARIGDQQHVD